MNMFLKNLKFTTSARFKAVTKKLRKSPILVLEADVDLRLRFPETVTMFYSLPHGAATMKFYSDGSCSAVMSDGHGAWNSEKKDETFRWEYMESDVPAIAFGMTHLAVFTTKSQFSEVVAWLELHKIKKM